MTSSLSIQRNSSRISELSIFCQDKMRILKEHNVDDVPILWNIPGITIERTNQKKNQYIKILKIGEHYERTLDNNKISFYFEKILDEKFSDDLTKINEIEKEMKSLRKIMDGKLMEELYISLNGSYTKLEKYYENLIKEFVQNHPNFHYDNITKSFAEFKHKVIDDFFPIYQYDFDSNIVLLGLTEEVDFVSHTFIKIELMNEEKMTKNLEEEFRNEINDDHFFKSDESDEFENILKLEGKGDQFKSNGGKPTEWVWNKLNNSKCVLNNSKCVLIKESANEGEREELDIHTQFIKDQGHHGDYNAYHGNI